MNKKSIIITLDALIALFLTLSLVVFSFSYFSSLQTISWTKPNLFLVASDSLATLEISDDLKNVIESGSTTNVSTYLNKAFSARICAQLKIYNTTSTTPLHTITKSGCVRKYEVAFSRRTFIAKSAVHHATMETWYK